MDRAPIAIPIRSQVVDTATGSSTETTVTAHLMPAKAGTCEQCATTHDPEHPHNAISLFYQVRFNGENGRYPDWRDAMAHCADDIRELWTYELTKRGVDVAAGALRPGGRA